MEDQRISKQGNEHETEAGPSSMKAETGCMCEWWHQTTHNPTQQVRPHRQHSASVPLLRHRLVSLVFIPSFSLCQTGPTWPLFTSKQSLFYSSVFIHGIQSPRSCLSSPEMNTHNNYIKATMTTSYLGSYFGYMLSTAKQNLVYIVWGGKLIFVKSVSRGNECKPFAQ